MNIINKLLIIFIILPLRLLGMETVGSSHPQPISAAAQAVNANPFSMESELHTIFAHLNTLPKEMQRIIFLNLLDVEIESAEFLPRLQDIAILAKNFGVIQKTKTGKWKDDPSFKFIRKLKKKKFEKLCEINRKLYGKGISLKSIFDGINECIRQACYSDDDLDDISKTHSYSMRDLNSVKDYDQQRGFKEYFHQTPLHVAVKKELVDIIELLIKNGADINAQDGYLRTPLHIAAYEGLADIAELLIKNGAPVNDQDKYQNTPLHWAVYKKNDTRTAQILINNEAGLNMQNSGNETPLDVAVIWYGYANVVDFLIAQHATISMNDINRALKFAKANNQKDAIPLLERKLQDLRSHANGEK